MIPKHWAQLSQVYQHCLVIHRKNLPDSICNRYCTKCKKFVGYKEYPNAPHNDWCPNCKEHL